jgi:2-oxoglutarate dehydrogenase E1 component
VERIEEILDSYPNLQEVVWLQEEPENMGAWPFVHLQMHSQLRDTKVAHVARAESASPATGSGLVHAAEQADLLQRAVG